MAPHPERERDCELRARALLEAEFGCALKKIPEDRRIPTTDYRTVDGSRSVEVKRITSKAYNDLRYAASRMDWSYDSLILSGRWTVMISQLTLSDILKPMPKFPADDPEASAEAEAFGFSLIPRHEREAEWRASYPSPKRDTPRLKKLGPDLERHLHVLEQYAIYSTRGAWPSESDAWQALHYIASRTGNAICQWHELIRDEKPGINLALASGYNRTERADTVVGRIELWLASKQSSNLRESLGNEPNTEHHAVLVFDRYTEPEHQTAIDQGVHSRVGLSWAVVGEWILVGCR